MSSTFSMPLLLKTLFSPWRRLGGLGGKSIDAQIRSFIDNLISRVVGFITRLLVLIAGALIMLVVFIAGIVFTIIWPFIPVGIVYCVVRGIVG